MDTIYIQIRLKREYNGVEFNDAIYFTEDEYKDIKPSEIEKLKEERFNSFKESVDNPPVPVELTKEQLEEEKMALQKLIDEVNEKIAEKDAVIAEDLSDEKIIK